MYVTDTALDNVYSELVDLKVVIVASAGNQGGNVPPAKDWPKWLADPDLVKAELDGVKSDHGLAKVNDKESASEVLIPPSIPLYLSITAGSVKYTNKGTRGTELKNVCVAMMLVGAVDETGAECSFSQQADYVQIYAPGKGWGISRSQGNEVVEYVVDDKTGKQVLVTSPDGSRVPQNYRGTSLGKLSTPVQQHTQLTKRKPPRW